MGNVNNVRVDSNLERDCFFLTVFRFKLYQRLVRAGVNFYGFINFYSLFYDKCYIFKMCSRITNCIQKMWTEQGNKIIFGTNI